MACFECQKLSKVLECLQQDEKHWYKRYLELKENGDVPLRTEYEQEVEQKKKEIDNLKMIIISQSEDLRRAKLEKTNPHGKIKEIPKNFVDDYYGEYARPMNYVDLKKVIKGDGKPLEELLNDPQTKVTNLVDRDPFESRYFQGVNEKKAE